MKREFLKLLKEAKKRGEFNEAPCFWQDLAKRAGINPEEDIMKDLQEIINHKKEMEVAIQW